MGEIDSLWLSDVLLRFLAIVTQARAFRSLLHVHLNSRALVFLCIVICAIPDEITGYLFRVGWQVGTEN